MLGVIFKPFLHTTNLRWFLTRFIQIRTLFDLDLLCFWPFKVHPKNRPFCLVDTVGKLPKISLLWKSLIDASRSVSQSENRRNRGPLPTRDDIFPLDTISIGRLVDLQQSRYFTDLFSTKHGKYLRPRANVESKSRRIH